MIQVENLSKHFGRVVAVDGISFEVKKGEILGFLGPNGAGKSTTLKMLVGLLTPTSGRAIIGGHDIADDSLAARRMIGHLPEGNPLYDEMTLGGFLRFVADAKGLTGDEAKNSVEESILDCDLGEMRGRLIRHLSKGFRQRVGIAQALIGNPPVLILDEPTVGLDPKQIIEIRHLIRRCAGDRTVILSTHILPEVEATCDRAIIISHGKLRAEGTPERLAEGSRESTALRLDLVHSPANAVNEIADLASVTTAITLPHPGENTMSIQVTGPSISDVRHEVMRRCVDRGWEVAALTSLGADLERAFLDAIAEDPD